VYVRMYVCMYACMSVLSWQYLNGSTDLIHILYCEYIHYRLVFSEYGHFSSTNTGLYKYCNSFKTALMILITFQ
jgi:hypothetical protein